MATPIADPHATPVAAREARKLRDAEQRRRAIIRVVRRLIRKGGLGGVSLRKVAELAGYSTTVVYSLFGDKATLIAQAMDEDLLELTRTMGQAVALHREPLARIRAMARAYIDFGLQHPAEYAFVFMQPRPHAPNASVRVRHGVPSEDPYAMARTLWVDLAATGLVRHDEVEVDLMLQIFWEGIHGLTARHLVMGADDAWFPPVPADRHVALMIEVLLDGILLQFKP